MCGHTRKKIGNQLRDKVGVISIEDTMRENTFRWFGHVKRSVDAHMRRCEM